MNIKYRIIININGNNEIITFLINESEIILIVVSEKIIINRPLINVVSFNLEYLEFSFDKMIKRNGTSANTKI
tara:strand:- start:162 stop:380 length:219 start_codon:yes stop_codon:yes gene_type:complete